MSARSPITTHVLDTARGRPAVGLALRLEKRGVGGYEILGVGITDDDGRVTDLLAPGGLTAGVHRMVFRTGEWLAKEGIDGFYPEVSVVFEVTAPDEHHHIPLLLSPFGYSTYRGS